MLRVSVKRSEKQIFTRAERICNDVVAAQTKEKKTKDSRHHLLGSLLQFRLAASPSSFWLRQELKKVFVRLFDWFKFVNI